MMDDEFDHFTAAQDTVWDDVIAELTAGAKRTHWMWFVFPVLEGVGQSPNAMLYALRDRDEARAYMAHPVAGPRLAHCVDLVLTHAGTPAATIFGKVDAYKLHNCATLFALAAPASARFGEVLSRFFEGQHAATSLALLKAAEERR